MNILIITHRDHHKEAYHSVFKHLDFVHLTIIPSGIEGLSILKHTKPEIVFIDSECPDISALEWLENAHKCDYFPYLIVNLFRSSSTTKVQLMKAGACDLIEAQFLEADIRSAFEKANRRLKLISHIEFERDKANHIALKAALNGFKSFVESRFYTAKPITLEEIQQFFPHFDLSAGLTAEKIVGAIHEDNLSKLVAWNAPSLLCVEDEEAIQSILDRTFSDLELTSAMSAEEAIKLVMEKPFDTAIVDIGLPKMQGDELVAELKTLCPTMDVIMLTAFDDAKLIVNSFRNGACDYIVKPFDIDDLRNRVAQHYEYKMVAHSLDISIKNFIRHYKET